MAREADRYYPHDVRARLKYNLCGPSVYGKPDPVVLRQLSGVKGRILEIGAGDGRYTLPLLRQADVFGLDIYPEELRILRRRYLYTRLRDAGEIINEAIPNVGRAARKLRKSTNHKLQTGIVDAFQTFPFNNDSFDALVTTGFLYLYPEDHIRKVILEAHRVLKPNGTLVFDFVIDRQRIRTDGTEILGENEVKYTQKTGMETVKHVLENLFGKIDVQISKVDQDLTESAGYTMKATKLNIRTQKI